MVTAMPTPRPPQLAVFQMTEFHEGSSLVINMNDSLCICTLWQAEGNHASHFCGKNKLKLKSDAQALG